MKYFLLGLVVWFVVAWFPHFIKAWFINLKFRREAKKANSNNIWMYEV